MFLPLALYINSINLIFAVAGLGVLALTVVLLADYFKNEQRLYRRYVAPFVWWIIIATSVGGVTVTLLYSEVFGFVPCSLCWLQRVALYPLAMLAVVAFKIGDKRQFPLYGIVLASFGLLVATYQYVYQSLPPELLERGVMPCLADGSADCAKKVMEVFGFVTFPFLSAVLFLFLIALFLHLRREQHIT